MQARRAFGSHAQDYGADEIGLRVDRESTVYFRSEIVVEVIY